MNTRNTGLLFVGLVLIAIGVVSLISNWIDVNWFSLLCPSLLIFLGVWMLIRPRQVGFIGDANVVFIGEIERSGSWQATGESFLTFVGDIDLDLTKAELPLGETSYSFTGFVTDAEVLVPADVGVRLSAAGFITEVKIQGHKQERFLAPLNWTSENYAAAERKIRLDATGFVNELKVRQV
ncbi:MAG: cell wall-active antibiotics response protein LiaF [Chloroflexota bacterium]